MSVKKTSLVTAIHYMHSAAFKADPNILYSDRLYAPSNRAPILGNHGLTKREDQSENIRKQRARHLLSELQSIAPALIMDMGSD